MTEKMKVFNVGLPPALMDRVKADAKAQDKPISRVLRDLLNLGFIAKDMKWKRATERTRP